MTNFIQHPGEIMSIKDGVVCVKIEQTSACVSCQVKGICSAAEKQDKTIEVDLPDETFKEGDKVLIFEKSSLGFKAVLYAYVIPLSIVVFILFFLLLFSKNEVFAGIIALLSLVPYYIIFSLLKKKLKKTFVFTLKKAEGDNLNCIVNN